MTPQRPAPALPYPVNHFDSLRLFAALVVLYGHSIPPGDFFSRHFGFRSLAEFGVDLFFVVSGYLITYSYDRQQNLLDFAANRLLRILPALWMVILLTTFVLGPWVTSLSLGEYFRHPMTWGYLQGLLVFPMQLYLPGVFEDTWTGFANGPLWSLPQEMFCYIGVALLGALGGLRLRWAVAVFLLLMGLQLQWELGTGIGSRRLLEFYGLFAGGSIMYLARHRIPLHWAGFLLASAVFLGCPYLPMGRLLYTPALVYGLIFLAFRLPASLPSAAKYGDFSYGVYLYAFLFQQLYLPYAKQGHFWTYLALVLAGTFVMAAFSWFCVEQPALRLKRRRQQREEISRQRSGGFSFLMRRSLNDRTQPLPVATGE